MEDKAICVTGSRTIGESDPVKQALEQSFDGDELLVGDADGVDSFVKEWYQSGAGPKQVAGVELTEYPIPDWVWDELGQAAGPIRNRQMVDDADHIIAVWDGESAGTKQAIEYARSSVPIDLFHCVNDRRFGWTVDHCDRIETDQAELGEF